MKQKYVLTRRGEKETLTISEYTEVEKDAFSLICEESHDGATIRAAIDEGTEKLISTIRTHNMYPRKIYAEKIADGIIQLFESGLEDTTDLMFDDKDAFIQPEQIEAEALDVIEKDSVSADDLIDGDQDDDSNGATDAAGPADATSPEKTTGDSNRPDNNE